MKIEPRTVTRPSGQVMTPRSLGADDPEALYAFRNATYSETHAMARHPEQGAILEAIRTGMQACAEPPVN